MLWARIVNPRQHEQSWDLDKILNIFNILFEEDKEIIIFNFCKTNLN